MSIKAIKWVVQHSEARLSARLVLLALAEHANDFGRMAYPSLTTLARETRLSRVQVIRAIETLEKEGHVLVKRKGSPIRTNLYEIRMNSAPSFRMKLPPTELVVSKSAKASIKSDQAGIILNPITVPIKPSEIKPPEKIPTPAPSSGGEFKISLDSNNNRNQAEASRIVADVHYGRLSRTRGIDRLKALGRTDFCKLLAQVDEEGPKEVPAVFHDPERGGESA